MSGVETMAILAGGTMALGQVSAAQASAEAAQRNAGLKRLQAEELLSRQEINEQIILEESKRLELGYGSAFAATGREGAGLGGIMQIRKNTMDNIANSRRDAEFKAKMLRLGADIESDLASDSLVAGLIGAGGTLLSGGLQAYNMYRGPSNPKSLPGVP